MSTITAWTHDDLLTDLKAEVLEVRKEYGVPSLNHIPDFELVTLAYAQLGDLVHIGKGRIGEPGMAAFLAQPGFRGTPFILETPKDSPGADKRNLAAVRRLAERRGVS